MNYELYQQQKAELEKKYFDHQLDENEYFIQCLILEDKYTTHLYKSIDADPMAVQDRYKFDP